MDCIDQALRQAKGLHKKGKALLAFAIMTAALTHSAQAQTFAEWFSQKRTQKKYLLQQIAALQVYSGYLKTGYGIAKGGLGSIGGYINNEFNMHSGHYKSLKTVSASVKNSPEIKDIIHWQQDILKQTAAIKKQAGLTNPEGAYTAKVCQSLLVDCDAHMNDLQTVLSDNEATMSDEERIRQIARLHMAMQDNYRFAANFRAQVQLYVRNKQQENKDITTLTQLYANR
ncbi:MAG: hypothetical protein V4553_02465 [Bacteroidota bacterium]